MMCVFFLNRITGKNYDFLNLAYFSYFQGDKRYKSMFLVETSYTIRYSLNFLLLS